MNYLKENDYEAVKHMLVAAMSEFGYTKEEAIDDEYNLIEGLEEDIKDYICEVDPHNEVYPWDKQAIHQEAVAIYEDIVENL